MGSVVTYGENAASWLPGFLDLLRSRRRPVERIEQVALVLGSRDRAFLVIQWGGYFERVELHLVEEASPRRLLVKFLWEEENQWAEVSFPGGGVPFPGEPAVIQVYAGGGSAGGTYRLLQLRRQSVEITPWWAGYAGDDDGLSDPDGDGIHEWIGDSYVAMPHGCDGISCAGVELAVVLRRVDGKFVPACRDFPEFYQSYETRGVLDSLIRRVLNAAQRLDFTTADEAYAALEYNISRQESLCCGYGWNFQDGYLQSGNLLPDVKLLLETTKQFSSWACPVQAAEAWLAGVLDNQFLEGRLP